MVEDWDTEQAPSPPRFPRQVMIFLARHWGAGRMVVDEENTHGTGTNGRLEDVAQASDDEMASPDACDAPAHEPQLAVQRPGDENFAIQFHHAAERGGDVGGGIDDRAI